VLLARTLQAQPGTISTVASQLNGPYSVSIDSAGNIYISDWNNQVVRKVSPGGGVISTIDAGFNFPEDADVDRAGNIYIADSHNNRIVKVSPSGAATNIAGKPRNGGYDGEGSATSVLINLPAGVALDSAGNVYIADQANHRIRKVTPDGTISTVVGTGVAGFSGDG